jgi:hypothetical protein
MLGNSRQSIWRNMNKEVNWYNLCITYAIFSIVYSAIIWGVWAFLFEPFFNIHFTYLQVIGAYTSLRLLFGNTSTNYISNFYSSKAPDLNKIDDYLKQIEADLDKEADEVEKQYEDLNKKD